MIWHEHVDMIAWYDRYDMMIGNFEVIILKSY
jgi:hypothetical protein